MSRFACAACRRRLIRGHASAMPLSLLILLATLAVMGVACGGGGNSSDAATPGAGARASVSPTAALITVPGGVQLRLYRGDGFSIGYLPDWQVSPAGSSVEFSHEADSATLSVQVVPNPNAATSPEETVSVSLDTFEKSGLYKNFKRVSLAPTVTVGGQIWQQQGATGDVQILGQQVRMEIVLLATNHPAHSAQTRLFSIYIVVPEVRYQQLSGSAFVPMLQSFRFLG
ncbi:hypothetical protein [Thermogemmatispora tikiterensis]|uniref:Uncharacterized protein n=1 Tax=Thermogemmatispora tikiterensis TaxID=1825093 RepID=A0A328VV57_9CHLR|nr:hypothetical protein [Thermogemmatispora tikiterensis]RAQ97975.1 hypothetical protein A4R35_20720 [Thermogemmatispora tikiterensis]